MYAIITATKPKNLTNFTLLMLSNVSIGHEQAESLKSSTY